MKLYAKRGRRGLGNTKKTPPKPRKPLVGIHDKDTGIFVVGENLNEEQKKKDNLALKSFFTNLLSKKGTNSPGNTYNYFSKLFSN